MASTQTAHDTALRDGKSLAPAVTRAAALLSLLAEPGVGALGVSDLARHLGLPKSSIGNLCAALEEAGLVRRTDRGFQLGRRILELGSAYLSTIDPLQDFHEMCRQLRSASRESLLLATLDGLDVLYLARHDGTQPIRLASDIGRRLPAGCTALGKAMLAQLDPRIVEDRYRQLPVLPTLTPNSLASVGALLEELERTRERGYAVDDEENTVGIVCFSVAVPGSDSDEFLAASVTLLKARLTDALRDDLVADLRQLTSHLALRTTLSRGEGT